MTAWQNRIVGYREAPPGELKAHALNWRTHGTFQRQALLGVLRQVGIVQNVVVSARTGTLLDGHLRVELALEEGQPVVPVTLVDVDADEERLILATLDPLSALADVDSAHLRQVLDELSSPHAAVNELLFDLSRHAGPEAETPEPEDVPAKPDQAAALRRHWGTQPGQLWTAGPHRLLCGDSTKADDLSRLMAGVKSTLLCTDPPYGMGEDWHGLQTYRGHKPLANDRRRTGQLDDVIVPALRQACELGLTSDASLYLWFRMQNNPRPVAESLGWTPHATIIWVKEHFNVGRADYHSQYEPCLYASRGRRYWCGARDQSDVWHAKRVEEERLHPTQKPLSLTRRQIDNNSRPGDVVLDLFGGSGTTVIACAQTGRVGYSQDIDPAWLAVSLQRLADLGLEPRLVEGGA